MAVANTLAYYDTSTVTAIKRLTILASGACTIKHYKLIMYGKWT
jgi:hypothetical protein